MIINPYTHKEAVVPISGTRILQEDFGLVGTVVRDPFETYRWWRVETLYSPLRERALGGIRAKLSDQKGFISFLTQMDLEVLLGIARPGEKCKWSGKTYQAPGDCSFFGLCADDDVLADDLYDRELLLRAQSPTGILAQNTELIRRVHVEDGVDEEEYFIMLWDGDLHTGLSPDTRMSTLEKRWKRVEKTRVRWEFV